MTAAVQLSPEREAILSNLRPAMLALIRTHLTGDYWTTVSIERGHLVAERDTLAVLAGVGAGMLREACRGDTEAAVAIVDRWLSGALAEAARAAT
jgi:hypothetical protein